MRHIFDVDYAVKYGLNAAVLLDSIIYFCTKNFGNQEYWHIDRYWCEVSQETFVKMLPYLTRNMIRQAIADLKDNGAILAENIGNRNKTWYALGDDINTGVEPYENQERPGGTAPGTGWIPPGTGWISPGTGWIPPGEHIFNKNNNINNIYNNNNINNIHDDNIEKEIKEKETITRSNDANQSQNNGTAAIKTPSLDECLKYFEFNNRTSSDAEEFFEYYESIGWVISGNPIIKWKYAANRWMTRSWSSDRKRNEKQPVTQAAQDALKLLEQNRRKRGLK
jgi:hypothetical protein